MICQFQLAQITLQSVFAMSYFVITQLTFSLESLSTLTTDEGANIRVNSSHVQFQLTLLDKLLGTFWTLIFHLCLLFLRFFLCSLAYFLVFLHPQQSLEIFSAERADDLFLTLPVSAAHVKFGGVCMGEYLLAQLALERPLADVSTCGHGLEVGRFEFVSEPVLSGERVGGHKTPVIIVTL